MALLEESLSQPTEDTGMQSVLRTLLKKQNKDKTHTHTLISNFFKSTAMFWIQYLRKKHDLKKKKGQKKKIPLIFLRLSTFEVFQLDFFWDTLSWSFKFWQRTLDHVNYLVEFSKKFRFSSFI